MREFGARRLARPGSPPYYAVAHCAALLCVREPRVGAARRSAADPKRRPAAAGETGARGAEERAVLVPGGVERQLPRLGDRTPHVGCRQATQGRRALLPDA